LALLRKHYVAAAIWTSGERVRSHRAETKRSAMTGNVTFSKRLPSKFDIHTGDKCVLPRKVG
jgi:hypothetical protein